MKSWRCFFLILAFALSVFVRAQSLLEDDFSDGDFLHAPTWMGTAEKFKVIDHRLQLFDSIPASSNTAYLGVYAPTVLDDSVSWTFWIKLDFAPSTANHARVYLMASEANLEYPQYGYYLKIGGVGGAGDALELYRQDGDQHSLLLQGSMGSLGQQPALVRVHVNRNKQGLWTILADYEGSENWQVEGQVVDTTYVRGDYFGWVCKYTSTRNEHFFLDDVFIYPLYQDSFPPLLEQVIPQSADSLLLIFDESLDEVSASSVENYFIEPGIGHPLSAAVDVQDNRQVQLRLATPMEHLQFYSLTANAIRDELGNTSSEMLVYFTYYDWPQAVPYQLLITEIMADPTPAVALPPYEYLELYNNGPFPLQLEGYGLWVDDKEVKLPAYVLQPDSLLILCDLEAATTLEAYGAVLPLDLPTLVNSGSRLEIRNRDGKVVHTLNYNTDWYRSTYKDDGGWSLEMINPLAVCRGEGNWSASEDLRGGSPGQRNASYLAKADTLGARLLYAYPLTERLLRLQFDKSLDSLSAISSDHYRIEPLLPIDSVEVEIVQGSSLLLHLGQALEEGTVYTLDLQGHIYDCMGQELQLGQSVRFGLPKIPMAGDILINELLYDPQTGGKDFIELYNASDAIFDLQDLLLVNTYQGSDSIRALDGQRLFLPGAYFALTPSPADIRSRYFLPRPDWLIRAALPVFAPPEGEVVLYALTEQGDLRLIDRLPYSDKLHSPLLEDTKGVSLERISLLRPTLDPENWTSAAEQQGATPTGENSQRLLFAERPFVRDQSLRSNFYLEYPLFLPDGDGYRDLLPIRYVLRESGALVNLLVFDLRGRLCKQLALMRSIGTDGYFFWAGEDDEGRRLPDGVYLLWVECIFADGIEHHRMVCSLKH